MLTLGSATAERVAKVMALTFFRYILVSGIIFSDYMRPDIAILQSIIDFTLAIVALEDKKTCAKLRRYAVLIVIRTVWGCHHSLP